MSISIFDTAFVHKMSSVLDIIIIFDRFRQIRYKNEQIHQSPIYSNVNDLRQIYYS